VSNLPKLSLTKRVRVVRWICRRHDRSCAGFLPDASPVDPRVGPVLCNFFMWGYYGCFFSGGPTESIGTTFRRSVLSIMILSVPCMMRSMVSKYMRLRVTSGAFLYSS
jgi:hypothetical protein